MNCRYTADILICQAIQCVLVSRSSKMRLRVNNWQHKSELLRTAYILPNYHTERECVLSHAQDLDHHLHKINKWIICNHVIRVYEFMIDVCCRLYLFAASMYCASGQRADLLEPNKLLSNWFSSTDGGPHLQIIPPCANWTTNERLRDRTFDYLGGQASHKRLWLISKHQ